MILRGGAYPINGDYVVVTERIEGGFKAMSGMVAIEVETGVRFVLADDEDPRVKTFRRLDRALSELLDS